MKKLAAFALVLVIIGGGANVFRQWLFRPASDDSTQVTFEVTTGQSFQKIAQELEDQGFIRNAKALILYSRLTGKDSRIKVGEYQLARNLPAQEILAVLLTGRSINHYLTITEGQDLFDIADTVERLGLSTREDFLSLTQDPDFASELLGESQPSLEGYLFPETYAFSKFTDLKSIIKEMVKRFISVYDYSIKPNVPPGWSRKQVVTLASIIEKETGASFERAVISSVFHNRLKIKMRLQTDPTVIYGLTLLRGHHPANIKKADLSMPSPYNTYVIYGLPPGPISNPGREALLAAVKPNKTDYLFFVSQNDGTHVFSKDYKAHQSAVGKYQLDRKAREGKSWRDLKK